MAAGLAWAIAFMPVWLSLLMEQMKQKLQEQDLTKNLNLTGKATTL